MQNFSKQNWSLLLGSIEKTLISPWEKFIAYTAKGAKWKFKRPVGVSYFQHFGKRYQLFPLVRT